MNNPKGRPPLSVPKERYWGVYTGYIRDVNDPDRKGRIRCYCPTVMGEIDSKDKWLDWALPSFAWIVNQGTGKPAGAGFIPAAAQPESDKWGVHIQFREGDARFPVWMGVFPLQKLDTDDLVLEATKKLTLKVGSNTIVIDGDTGLVEVNGNSFKMPKWNPGFEPALASYLNGLVGAINAYANTAGIAEPLIAPAATTLAMALSALSTFVTNLGNGTFDSAKAKNG